MAQSFRPPEDPLEDLPEPQPDVQGAANTSLDCGSNVYEKQELLHRPHAFALIHGENGAKVAYGELHWSIDVLIANFKTTTISVNDHCDHSHAPHANHSHSAHTDHSHADHTDHPSHTHTAGVASHTHTYPHTHTHDHTHDLFHTHTTNLGGATSTGQPDEATTGIQSGSGYGDHTHEHDHTHSISQHSHTTTSIDDATTDSISSTTTSTSSPSTTDTNDPSASGNVTTSGPNATLTHSSHSGVKDVSDGSASAPAEVLGHSNAVNADGSALGDDTAGVLKHSGVTATDGTTAPDCVLKHTLTVVEDGGTITESGASVTIDHVDKMGQQAIPDITQQVPNIDTEDGDPMLSEIPNEYFQLTGFGDVYLVWKVDLELAPEVQKCWVQVGEPDNSPISSIGVSSAVTDRLDNDPESSSTEGTYSVKIGTVTEDNRIQQRVSGDVSWRPVVLDRT